MTAYEKADDIYVHIYQFPEENLEDKYEGVYAISRAWQRANPLIPIAYNQHTIMAFNEITKREGCQPLSYEHRTIDIKSSFERALLERLIKNSFLLVAEQSRQWERRGNDLYIRASRTLCENNIYIFKTLALHVNIIDNRICISFHLAHKFEYKKTVQHLLNEGWTLKPGMTLMHRQYTYTLERLANYSVMDHCPLLQTSIYDYYMQRGLIHIANTLHERINVVHVRANEQLLSYAANLLKPICSFETMMPREVLAVSEQIKMSPNERMRQTFTYMSQLQKIYPYLTFHEKPFLIEHNGYQTFNLKKPMIYFNQAFHTVTQGLMNCKNIYKGGDVNLSIFLDEDFIHQKEFSRTLILQFIQILRAFAKRHGVDLHISTATQQVKGKFTNDFFKQFSFDIQQLQEAFANSTVLAFITEAHLASSYHLFKQQFGGTWDISSQIVTENIMKGFEKLLKNKRKSDFNVRNPHECNQVMSMIIEANLHYTIFNILLGIYVKSGLQPWILARPTHSDCFIGLDVSHENGNSAAGMINVIGSQGHLIKQASIHGRLAGEKIDEALVRKLLEDVLQAYKQQFNRYPRHITIHRDGFWRESTRVIDEVLEPLHIQYDIVEILKKPNRRMAYYDFSEKEFYTSQGTCYTRGKEALLCATNPTKKIGMAQPVKIRHVTNSLNFKQIIEDVYHLSFMHIHSTNKMRLPATIHYADLSATAYQRGEILPQSANKTSLPFV